MNPISPKAIIFAVLLSGAGCAALDPPYSDIIDRRYNGWLGKSKDDRMRVSGPPERCAQLQSGEEACEWKIVGIDGSSVTRFVTVSSWLHRVVFVYDRNGVARAWHYSGTWGERSSSGAAESTSRDIEGLLP